MGAGSLLALMARRSLLLARQHSILATADIDLIDYERPSHGNHAQLAEEQSQPAGAQLHLLNSFHVDLAERLQQLQIQDTESAHLNWLLDALASTLSTHSSLQSAFTAAGAGAHSSSKSSGLKHRADEVLNMLDVCSALKQVADDMDQQSDRLQHALLSVGTALSSGKTLSSGRLRAAAHKLSACLLQERSHTNVISIIGRHYRPLAEARSSLALAAKRVLQSPTTLLDPTAALLSQALDGALLTSLLILAAAVSSLAPPPYSSRKRSSALTSACKMTIKNLGAKISSATPWAAPLRQLQHDLRQEDLSAAGGSLFRELQGLHSAATKLHATITTPGAPSSELAIDLKQSVESLRKSLAEAQSCVSMLRIQLASFFHALIALRLALLDS